MFTDTASIFKNKDNSVDVSRLYFKNKPSLIQNISHIKKPTIFKHG